MDIKDLKGLVEAYQQINAPQEVDEAVKGESSERRKDLAAERRAGVKPLSAKEGEKYASHKLSQMAYAKRKRMGEELDIFDAVLEFLQAEGYAETLEEAQWMMANLLDKEEIDIIIEAIHEDEDEGEEDKKEMKKEKKGKKEKEEDEEDDDDKIEESAIGTMAVLGGMAAGRAIHGKLQSRKAKKELEAKRKTSDYLGMKSRTKNVVARDRRASGDTR